MVPETQAGHWPNTCFCLTMGSAVQDLVAQDTEGKVETLFLLVALSTHGLSDLHLSWHYQPPWTTQQMGAGREGLVDTGITRSV